MHVFLVFLHGVLVEARSAPPPYGKFLEQELNISLPFFLRKHKQANKQQKIRLFQTSCM